MSEREEGNEHRLDGLEPDNLLAFLALLGLLRALGHADASLRVRVSWTLDEPPLRPRLHLSRTLTATELTEKIASGIAELGKEHDFDGRENLNYDAGESRALLKDASSTSSVVNHVRADLLAALMSDVALKDGKESLVDPTPLCLLFGQGHQHFLARLTQVPILETPPLRGKGKHAVKIGAQECIAEALFLPWHREDRTPSFRWDPNEDVRYAMMAGDPTDNAYKSGTQHGANRLAAVGLATLTLAPGFRAKRIRPCVVGGAHDAEGFSVAWPIWREPATLAAIAAMLAHPKLRTAGALQHLGVDHVMMARRISVGKFMNFTRARPLTVDEIENKPPLR